MTTSKTNGSFTPEFIQQALALAEQMGVAQASRDLGILSNNIYRWRKQLATEGANAFRGKGRLTPEAAELARLRRELQQAHASEQRLRGGACAFKLQTLRTPR